MSRLEKLAVALAVLQTGTGIWNAIDGNVYGAVFVISCLGICLVAWIFTASRS